MNWWCAATGESWTWAWRAYPGVWLFVLLLGWWAIRGAGRWSPWTIAGLACIWFALDWPLGALGAGYLVSAHTLSYILLTLVAPPCLLLGVPRATIIRALDRPVRARLLRLAARPALALGTYAAVLGLTHVPGIVDGLMDTQVGALLVDLAWLGSGFLLWWPVMAPQPELSSIQRPMKMAYLFAATLPAIIPSAFLTFAEYPLYATYELAPRVFPILTAREDQKVAGLLMKVVGDLPLWFAFGVIFFRWSRASQSVPPPVHPSAARGEAHRPPRQA